MNVATAIDLSWVPTAVPDLDRLETIVTLCEQRLRRADQKAAAAAAEQVEAAAALELARTARDHWIVNNDDPQMMMF